MTSSDLTALLRADPQRAVEAIQAAKVAGPWEPAPQGQRGRRAWSGQTVRGEWLRVAANTEAEIWHDNSLRDEGWVLA